MIFRFWIYVGLLCWIDPGPQYFSDTFMELVKFYFPLLYKHPLVRKNYIKLDLANLYISATQTDTENTFVPFCYYFFA